jgi:ribosomal protein S27AE
MLQQQQQQFQAQIAALVPHARQQGHPSATHSHHTTYQAPPSQQYDNKDHRPLTFMTRKATNTQQTCSIPYDWHACINPHDPHNMSYINKAPVGYAKDKSPIKADTKPCFKCGEPYWAEHKWVCPKARLCYNCGGVFLGLSHNEVCPARTNRAGRGGAGGRGQQQQPHYYPSHAPQLPAAFGSAATVPGQQAVTSISQGQSATATSGHTSQEPLVDMFRQFLNNGQQLN